MSRLPICTWYQVTKYPLERHGNVLTNSVILVLCILCSLHASCESEAFNIQFGQEEKTAGSSRHLPCAHSQAYQSCTPHARGTPGLCLTALHRAWQSLLLHLLWYWLWLNCASAELLPISFRQGTICPTLNLPQIRGPYIVISNLIKFKRKTTQNLLFMWGADSVFLSGSHSVTDPTHFGRYKCFSV